MISGSCIIFHIAIQAVVAEFPIMSPFTFYKPTKKIPSQHPPLFSSTTKPPTTTPHPIYIQNISGRTKRVLKLKGVTRYEEGEFSDYREFENILKSDIFVDKTLLLKDLLEDENKYIAITAPKYFGKSIFLDTIRKFFEIIVNYDKKKITPRNRTRNYRIFHNTNFNLKISQDMAFLEEHLGTTPVIHMKFVGFGKHLEGLILSMQVSLTEIFLFYDFIPIFLKDRSEGMELFRKLSEDGVTDEDPDLVVNILVEYVFKYFQKKSIVVIDCFDVPVEYAISQGYSKFIGEVVEYRNSILYSFVNAREYVDRVIIAGNSRMYLASGTSSMEFKQYTFLDDHKYAKYIGFTQEEIDLLFNQRNIDNKEQKDAVKDCYNGFQVRNSSIHIYNPFDITEYFHSYELRPYWNNSQAWNQVILVKNYTGEWYRLSELLHHEILLRAAVTLLSTKKISFKLQSDATVEDLKLFSQMINGPIKKNKAVEFRLDLYLTYLFDRGYFSYTNEQDVYKIPNKEIEYRLRNELKLYFDTHGINIADPKLAEDVRTILKQGTAWPVN